MPVVGSHSPLGQLHSVKYTRTDIQVTQIDSDSYSVYITDCHCGLLTFAVRKAVVTRLALTASTSNDISLARALASEFITLEAQRSLWVTTALQASIVVLGCQNVGSLAALGRASFTVNCITKHVYT